MRTASPTGLEGTRWRPKPGHIVGFTLLSSIFAKSMAERLTEHDLWWHLKTGQLIVASHHLPKVDPFSFTAQGKPWVIQQWASEVILHGIKVLLGLRGIIIWRSVMLLIVYAVLAWLFVRIGRNTLGTWVVVGLAAYTGAPDWVERPTLFSFLIFAVVLSLAVQPSRKVWWCIPLFVLWANLHALVILGLGFMVLISIGEALKVVQGVGDAGWARRLRLVTLGCIIATFANPYGPKLLVYAVTLTRTVSSTAAEWASPDFHQILALPFLVLTLITVAALALSPKRADLTDVLLTITFLGLGLFAVRNLALSGMVLGFVSVKHAPTTVRAVFHREEPGPHTAVGLHIIPALAVILAVTAGLGTFVWHRFPRSDTLVAVSDPGFPVTTIASLPDSGVRLFSDDRWAALALYMKWPGTHVAFDGRGDLYGKAIIAKFQKSISGDPGWESWLNEICATHVLIQENSGLARVIEQSSDWRVLRRDPIAGGEAVLMTRSRPPPGCPARL